MKVFDLPTNQLHEAPWNPNQMDGTIAERLKQSLTRYGLVSPLVVRETGDKSHEVLSGNQRLKVIKDMGFRDVPCVVVRLDDAQAMLLAQALNGLHGQDDLGLKGSLLRKVLESIPEDQVLSVLPDSAESLRSLASLGEADLAEHLQAWQQAQEARLRHLQFQLVPMQLDVVEEALQLVLPRAKDAKGDNPNSRGTALYLLCKSYVESERTREANA